jgi:hypothetical protein
MTMVANLGYTPEEVVRMARNGTNYLDLKIRKRTKILMAEYRAKIMADIKSS